jgi:DNA adenine methylase
LVSKLKSPFRYPGGKGRWTDAILRQIPITTHFRDVFIGGGSIAIAVAQRDYECQIAVNDKDRFVSGYWQLIAKGTADDWSKFHSLIHQQPTVALFYDLRATEKEAKSLAELAYQAIFFNRCAFSGIATSGPIGGVQQASKWAIDCRYNAEAILLTSHRLAQLFEDRLEVHCLDFEDFFNKTEGFSYFDPPYFEKGNDLYRFGLTKKDHLRLRNLLQNKSDWLLSYDDAEFIEKIYSDCSISKINTRASITGTNRVGWQPKTELLIKPRGISNDAETDVQGGRTQEN